MEAREWSKRNACFHNDLFWRMRVQHEHANFLFPSAHVLCDLQVGVIRELGQLRDARLVNGARQRAGEHRSRT